MFVIICFKGGMHLLLCFSPKGSFGCSGVGGDEVGGPDRSVCGHLGRAQRERPAGCTIYEERHKHKNKLQFTLQ